MMSSQEKIKALTDIIDLARTFDFAFEKVKPLMEMRKELYNSPEVESIRESFKEEVFTGGYYSGEAIDVFMKWAIRKASDASLGIERQKGRIRRLYDLKCPDVILQNERRILIEYEHWQRIGNFLDAFQSVVADIPGYNKDELPEIADRVWKYEVCETISDEDWLKLYGVDMAKVKESATIS